MCLCVLKLKQLIPLEKEKILKQFAIFADHKIL